MKIYCKKSRFLPKNIEFLKNVQPNKRVFFISFYGKLSSDNEINSDNFFV
jgi:hypothetical protein